MTDIYPSWVRSQRRRRRQAQLRKLITPGVLAALIVLSLLAANRYW